MSAFTCCPRCGYRADAVLNTGKRGRKPIPPPEDLLEHFTAGETVTALSVRYRASVTLTKKWLQGLGITRVTGRLRAMTVPESVKAEYESGEAMSTLAVRYHTSIDMVKIRLHELGATIRKPGKCRLNADEIGQILAMDAAGEKHAVIGREFNVSRERIRQIVTEHGRPALWERRLGQAVANVQEAAAASAATELERGEKMELSNRLWKEGRPIEDCAAVVGKDPHYFRQFHINKYRKLGPEWFPYRRTDKINGGKP